MLALAEIYIANIIGIHSKSEKKYGMKMSLLTVEGHVLLHSFKIVVSWMASWLSE